jgi:deoxyxylulose-5-phosphate synthase
MSNFPGMKIYAPYNKESAERLFNQIYSSLEPTYIRIAKGGGVDDSEIKDITIGSNCAVITYGSASKMALSYARETKSDLIILEKLGESSFDLLDMNCSKYTDVIVLEDHFSHTGMYSYICQWTIDRKHKINIISIAPKNYNFNVGFDTQDFFGRQTTFSSGNQE